MPCGRRFRYHPTLVNYEKLLPTVQAVPMDEGFIDYKTFLTNLDAGGFAGPMAYEMCSPLRGGGSIQNLDSYARKFLSFAQGLASYQPSARAETSR